MPNLNKEITLLGHGKSAGKNAAPKRKGSIPTKTTINLVQPDSITSNAFARVISVLAVIALVCIFAKFLVVDPLAQVSESNNKLNAAKAQLAALEENNADYDSLSEEYAHYVVPNMNETEANQADRVKVVNLLKTAFASTGYDVASVAVNENVVTVTVVCDSSNSSASLVTETVAKLEESSIVDHVTVTTEQGDGDIVTSTIHFTLVDATESEE